MSPKQAALPILEWRNVTLNLGEFCVHDVSLHLDAGSWMCLTGPTGAGKTILLELAAGFLEPDVGRILRGGEDITTAPLEKRRLAYVPQDNLLFPHLTVLENLLYGKRGRREGVRDRFDEVVGDLQIGHLLHRDVHTISGGEAQRVALGRALLLDADVLLLDESTSALDEETREIVGEFLLRQRRDRSLSVVHVTHDRAEALRLATVLVSIAKGRIENIVANHPEDTRLRLTASPTPGEAAPVAMESSWKGERERCKSTLN